jgi:ElaB/YqjD/DUF883 family membrane-anchored ribosome-binding protein
MSGDSDRIVEDLQKLVAELETVIAHAQEAAGEHIGDRFEEAAAGLRGVLNTAQRRVGKLQAKLERRFGRTTKAAKESVRENPWGAVAIAAATALLLGFALARGFTGSERARGADGSRKTDSDPRVTL